MKSARKTKRNTSGELVFSPMMVLETRQEIKELLVFAVEYFSFPLTVDQTLQYIFEEEKGEADLRRLLAMFVQCVQEPELINTVYRLVHHTWLFFPHHRLNGRSPLEKMEQDALAEKKRVVQSA